MIKAVVSALPSPRHTARRAQRAVEEARSSPCAYSVLGHPMPGLSRPPGAPLWRCSLGFGDRNTTNRSPPQRQCKECGQHPIATRRPTWPTPFRQQGVPAGIFHNAKSPVFLALSPITATALGAAFLSERISVPFIVGLCCVALGLWLAHRPERPGRKT